MIHVHSGTDVALGFPSPGRELEYGAAGQIIDHLELGFFPALQAGTVRV